MKRPISLTIVGAAWFLIGVLGAVNDAIQTHGFATPGNNFINLLVGVGLLKGWRICRLYAFFVTGIMFVLMLPVAVWAVFNSSELVYRFPVGLMREQRPHEATSLATIILFFVCGLIISGWMFYVLNRQDVREFFQHKTNSQMPSIQQL